MFDILKDTLIPKNCNRKNVLVGHEKEYRGVALGIVYKWVGGCRHEECNKMKIPKYKLLFEQSSEYFKLNSPEPDFKFTTIQYNQNHKCAKHIDGKNIGDSYIIAFGDYEGGELIVYDENDKPTYIDIKNKFYKFNGSKFYHETADFTGTRYSLVYFSVI